MEHFDVVIIGAGLAGIGGACRLQTMCPDKSFVILEGRSALGGTWDLFRFPGIRSDSDMFTLSYPFRPWKGASSIAGGASILDYIRHTANESGVDRHIRYGQRVTRVSWSSNDGCWTVEADVSADRDAGGDGVVRYTAGFLYVCTGYYRYDEGYQPAFADADSFPGPVIHPQHWPADLDYRDRNVVIVGSGATAMTMAPAMASAAAHVTVLQRSPSYVLSLPSVDPLWAPVRRALPEHLAFGILRWKNVLVATALYQLCRRRPTLAKRLLRWGTSSQLPADYDIDPNFTPTYDPWDQRMCIVPDGDLFKAISAGRVTMVTDHIERFTPRGIRLRSGKELDADIIVVATGLALVTCGDIHLDVDGQPVDPSQSFMYRGFMLSGVPNLAVCIGYTNASWTLRADLVSQTVCRLLNQMDRHGFTQAVPRVDNGAGPGKARPLLDLTAGYVQRAADRLPKQGTRGPWRFRQNYILDLVSAKFSDVSRDLSFSSRAQIPPGNGKVAAGRTPVGQNV